MEPQEFGPMGWLLKLTACQHKKCVTLMYQDGPHRGERERGMGKGSSHTVVYLDGEESSALIIWRWSARLPGGRVGSTPNESTSGASGKSRCETSSGGRIATTRPQQHPLSRMVAIPTGVD